MGCYACGGPLYGTYITAFGQNYHPHCFICQRCYMPIHGSYSVHDNQPYHPECLSIIKNLRCEACGELVLDEYTTALDKIWHIEHFRCTNCKCKFMNGKFAEKDGKAYCTSCYAELFLPRCSICDQPMTDTYMTNQWGESYCSFHENFSQKCTSCHRIIRASSSGAGVKHSDGRTTCNICSRQAIFTLDSAWPAYNKVRRFLARLGVDIISAQIPIELVDVYTINSLSRQYFTIGFDKQQTYGIISKTLTTSSGIITERKVNNISILYGLAWEQYTSVAAHEIGHAWLFHEQIDIPSPQTEEGFCELLSYLWLESLQSSTANGYMNILQNNQVYIYSEGLKCALQSYQCHGMAHVLATLRSTANFP